MDNAPEVLADIPGSKGLESSASYQIQGQMLHTVSDARASTTAPPNTIQQAVKERTRPLPSDDPSDASIPTKVKSSRPILTLSDTAQDTQVTPHVSAKDELPPTVNQAPSKPSDTLPPTPVSSTTPPPASARSYTLTNETNVSDQETIARSERSSVQPHANRDTSNPSGVFARGQLLPLAMHVLNPDQNKMATMTITVSIRPG